VTVDLTELAIDAAATARLVRLLRNDTITQPVRDRIIDFDPEAKHVGYVLSCESCSAVWAAATVVILPRKLRYLLALSEIAFRAKAVLDANY
jgi:hypothetical protein